MGRMSDENGRGMWGRGEGGRPPQDGQGWDDTRGFAAQGDSAWGRPGAGNQGQGHAGAQQGAGGPQGQMTPNQGTPHQGTPGHGTPQQGGSGHGHPTQQFADPRYAAQHPGAQQYPQYAGGAFGAHQGAPQPGGVATDPGAGGPGGPNGPVPPYGQPERRGAGSGKGMLAAAMVVGMLLAGGIGGVVGASVSKSDSTTSLSAPANPDQPVTPAPDGSVEAVADKVRPSVVSIEVQGQTAAGEGSGVVLSNDGLIVTNNHVVDIAKNGGKVEVQFMDGTSSSAKVVGADPATDIAVIKADTTQSLTPISLGTSSTLRVGQAVAAVGSPLGLSGTVTTGIVSALDRPVRAGGSQSDQSTVIDAVQTDAAVNPGNSGGALVNMNGELIGINSAIASLGSSGEGGESGSIGLGFAIPVDQARRIADQLIKQGYATRAVIGLSVTDSRDQAGAAVRTVEPNGPAAKAGIPQNAVVTKVGDRVIDGGDALVAAIRSHAPGDVVKVTYAASGSTDTKTADVTLGEQR